MVGPDKIVPYEAVTAEHALVRRYPDELGYATKQVSAPPYRHLSRTRPRSTCDAECLKFFDDVRAHP